MSVECDTSLGKRYYIGVASQAELSALIDHWKVVCETHSIAVDTDPTKSDWADCYGVVKYFPVNGISVKRTGFPVLEVFGSKDAQDRPFVICLYGNVKDMGSTATIGFLLLPVMKEASIVLWETPAAMILNHRIINGAPSDQDWVRLLRKMETVARKRSELICSMKDSIVRYLLPTPPGPNEWSELLMQMVEAGKELPSPQGGES